MMGLGRPILTTDELNAHVAALGSTQDVIYAPLYDAAAYAAAGQTQLVFFTAPIGQGTTSAPGASGTKTNSDTNLQSAGQLTLGNDFFMTGQEFLFFSGALPEQVGNANLINGQVNDNYLVGKSGNVVLTVGSNRQYIQDGPLMLFPPCGRLAVAAAVGGNATAGTQTLMNVAYATFSGEPYSITPIYIQATQGFQESINWPAAVAVSATGRIFSRMDGYLIRNAQ